MWKCYLRCTGHEKLQSQLQGCSMKAWPRAAAELSVLWRCPPLSAALTAPAEYLVSADTCLLTSQLWEGRGTPPASGEHLLPLTAE